ncbi:MAG: hypothetical protein H0X51_00070 [Parachlamydiaceae bacterium]|nr:hypothetical protein [Parachlamydiaceae bacterium]
MQKFIILAFVALSLFGRMDSNETDTIRQKSSSYISAFNKKEAQEVAQYWAPGGREFSPGHQQTYDQARDQLMRDRPRQGDYPGSPAATNATRNQVQDFLNSSGTTTGGQSQAVQNLSGKRGDRQQWQNNANGIRERVSQNNIRNDLDHNQNWNRDGNYWRGASWGTVAAWGAWGWGTPYYYDYEEGYPYAYSDSYSGYAPIPQISSYQEQQAQLSSQVVSANSTGQGWLPIGNFAVIKQGEAIVTPNLYLQLSLSKEGSIQGTLFNTTTNITHGVLGRVDPQTQIAAWKIIGNENSPIMETGIYNLTQSETPVQVNFYDNSYQVWMLVRL